MLLTETLKFTLSCFVNILPAAVTCKLELRRTQNVKTVHVPIMVLLRLFSILSRLGVNKVNFSFFKTYKFNKLKMVLSCLYSYWHTLDVIKCSKLKWNHEHSENQIKLIFYNNNVKNIQKQRKSLKEKLFQERAGSVHERFVIQCLYTLIDNGWEPIILRDFALLL